MPPKNIQTDNAQTTNTLFNSAFSTAASTPAKYNIYLVRHGDVDIKPGTCYGQLDCAVSHSFDDDLLKLAEYFKSTLSIQVNGAEVIEAPFIISSPLTRCLKLAQGLKEYLESPQSVAKLQVNDAFKEIDFGLWEGESWQNIGQVQIEDWNNNLLDFTFPKGESARRFDLRIVNAWNVLLEKLASQQTNQQQNQKKTSQLSIQQQIPQTIILIGHAGVIRSILCDFLQIPLQHSLSLNIDKMSISCLNIVPTQIELSRCTGVNLSL